jgi:hypothetical protein
MLPISLILYVFHGKFFGLINAIEKAGNACLFRLVNGDDIMERNRHSLTLLALLEYAFDD